MKSLKQQIFNLFSVEYKHSDGFGKLFLVGMLSNAIPIIEFVPYLSQLITVFVLSIFLKKYLLRAQDVSNLQEKQSMSLPYASKIIIAITVGTMLFQIVWFPPVSQIITLVLLAVLYGTISKYT